MMRPVKALLAATGLAVTLVLPGAAGADTRWVCVAEGQSVVFVTAADAADFGIRRANERAGSVFNRQFGEVCHVE
jgi:hypothetical protein